jgi:hypothetical protein
MDAIWTTETALTGLGRADRQAVREAACVRVSAGAAAPHFRRAAAGEAGRGLRGIGARKGARSAPPR